MRIGELAATCGVSDKTIRYYESVGLLPAPARTPAGYRDYDEGAAARLRFIGDAQTTGLSLAEIASVLELKDAESSSCDHTRRLLEFHLDEIEGRIAALESTRAELSAMVERARALDPADCTDPQRCQVIGDGMTASAGSRLADPSPQSA